MTVRNFLSPGAIQPSSTGTGVHTYLSPGAVQPQVTVVTLLPSKVRIFLQAVNRGSFY